MIKKYWRRITGSGTLMSWTNNTILFVHGLVVTPLLLIKFDDTTLSFYYLLQTLLNLGLLADAGFGHTLQRSVAFYNAGAVRLPRNKEEFKNLIKTENEPNYIGLTHLLTTTNSIYLILLVFMIIMLSISGFLTLRNLLSISGYPLQYLVAFGLMVLSTGFTLLRVKWSSFMMGLYKVAELNQIKTLAAISRVLFYFVILLSDFGLLGLMIYVCIESIIVFSVIRNFVKSWFRRKGIKIKKTFEFHKDLFWTIWGVSWKSGLNTFGYFFVTQGVSLIIGQLKDTTQMANFLFTQRILTFIKGIAQAPFFAHTPKYFALISKKDFDKLKKESKGNIFLSLFILISGLAGFGLLGNYFLDLLHIDNRIVSWQIYLILSLVLVFDIHAVFHGTIYISTNSVPFLIPGLITGSVITILGYYISNIYGIFGVVLVQFLCNLVWNNWYSPYLSLKLVNWRFIDYLYDITVGGVNYWYNRFRKANFVF